MLHTYTHTFTQKPSLVTVKFSDGAYSFLLRDGATLAELADRIEVFGAQHDGFPISIDVEFIAPGSRSPAQSRHALIH